ncbi:hypothetical protein SORBI_3002G202600 [Sorghum bicolor]|uniref:BHLH domain-containing protein n=1 Tax=Sorghum bicolor TaxID=4558 RepID=A0A1W0W579_SORBI|nr:hypothetical protein SORBI_3002G202600 [Sorghum bicolor]
MQPTTREMQAMAAAGQISLDDLRAAAGAAGGGVHDDFLDQMLGGLPPSAWPELASAAGGKAPDGGAQAEGMQQHQHQHQHFGGGLYDESALLASRLRQHQISGGPTGGGAEAAKQMVLQQLADLRQGHHMLLQGMGRSTGGGGGSGDGGLLLPLSLGSGGSGGDVQALLKAAANSAGGEAAGVFGGSFAGSLQQQQQQHFQSHPQQTAPLPGQGFGGGGGGAGASGGVSQPQAGAAGGGAAAPPRQRVRARRGQATDPHSIAERLRRERIAERMKALQELVPNANKTDKASMLDEIIDYVKFLQLQVKVLSMSRLGGAAAVAPLVADMSSEGRGGAGAAAAAGSDGGLAVTEQQVAKLMEEDMGTAMQYLQGKGLCLMPVSLASAISSATCHMRPPVGAAGLGVAAAAAHHMAAMRLPPHGMNGGAGADASAMANGAGAGGADGDASHSQQQQHSKDAASVSKP